MPVDLRLRTIDVKAEGATGNGTTDDTTAIQAALNAVPSTGGEVFFPPGDYRISAPLIPKNLTLIRGTHVPQYVSSNNPDSSCKIRMLTGFTGTGMLTPTGATRGVSLQNIALVGGGIGTTLHGIRFPDLASVTGEMGWRFRDVTIAGFTGSGIYGRLHVADFNGVFLHQNTRYGIETAGSDRWNDVKVMNTYLYNNLMGGLIFTGGKSAYVNFTNCRFERSGQVAGNPDNSPASPGWNADAAGVRIEKGELLFFVNCSTDANTGPGYEIRLTAAGQAGQVQNIHFTSCYANRDGGGDQTANPATSSGFRVAGFSSAGADVAKEIHFSNCSVGRGLSDDGGASTLVSPSAAVRFKDAYRCTWSGRNPWDNSVDPAVVPDFSVTGDCYGSGYLYTARDGSLKYRKGGAAETSVVA